MFNWLRTQVLGVDLEEEQRRGDALDAKAADMNRKKLESGAWDYNQYEQAQANWARSNTGNVVGQVDQAFDEGLKEGFENTTGAIKSTLAAPFNFAFASIPWQLYVVAAAVLFWYMGGGLMLKGVLNRK